MGNNQSEARVCGHSSALIGDSLFVWGGDRPSLQFVHDSVEKRQFTASVDVFNPLNSSFVKRQTTGTPHTGIMRYSCCSVGDNIYYFGGQCKTTDCYHNNLCVLNTISNEWREITCSDEPMEKSACGMIPFSDDEEDYLLVIGGVGPLPANTPAHSQYRPIPYIPSLCYTNEIHIMCISAAPGKWTIPKRNGHVFPQPSGFFSIDTVPGGNKAIIFGGVCVNDQNLLIATNDVFIMSYTNNSVDIQKLVKPLDPNVEWPRVRNAHSSVVISSTLSTGVMKHYLLVLGGRDVDGVIVPDCWIMDIENKKWKQFILPDSVTTRSGHSMTSFQMSNNCVWLLITGGYSAVIGHLVASPNIVFLVELVYSPNDDKWSVTSILNERDMKNTAQYTQLVLDRLSVCRREHLMMERTEEASILVTELQLQHQINLSRLEEEQQRLQHCICENEEAIKQRDEVIQQNQVAAQQKYEIIRQNEEIIRQKDDTIREKEVTAQQNEERLRQKDETIHQNEEIIHQKDESIRQKEAMIRNLQSQLESCPWILQEEEVEMTNEKIGGGAYGEVKVAVFRSTRVAAKCLHEIIVSRHNRRIFTREMDISSKIHHPNIVQFIGATRVNNPILLYELMTTSLYERLQDDDSLTRPQIIEICCDIASALCYLHQWRPDPIIHRDVSSPNVLMEPLANNRWRSKLSDFGSASLQLHVKTVIPGNPAYSAPEARFPEDHTPAMDVYSFGVLATEMTLHDAPEMDRSRREEIAHTIDWIPMKQLVLNCIKNDRNQRLTSVQLLNELSQLN